MDNEAQGTINRRVAMHIKRRVSGWLTLAVLTVGGAMVASDPAFAKVDMDNLTIGGEARIRYEGRNNTLLNSNVQANESAGDHRLFGNFNWSQVGNSFDAAKLMYSTQLYDVDLFWARVFDTEFGGGCAVANNNCSGVIFPGAGSKGTTNQDIYGLYVTLKVV